MRRFIHPACIGLLIVLLTSGRLMAQQVLTLNEALRLALENNYSIQVMKNDAAVAKNNSRLGAAGMLPVITGTAGQDNQVVNTQQKFLTGAENNRSNAKSSSLTANVELGWTVFDGFKMFAAKNRLEELEKIGEYRMRYNIEQVFVRVTRAYYEVMLAGQQLKSNSRALANSEARLKFVEDRYQAGKSAKAEWLKARVDLNTDKSALMRQETVYANAKSALNQLLARDLNTPFGLPDSIRSDTTYQLNDLMGKVDKGNSTLLIMKGNTRVNLLSMREISAERMPTLQFKSGYNFSRQESQAGFLQYAQNNGYHLGAGLSINLFNGFDVSRRLQNAKLSYRSADLIYKDSVTRVQHQLKAAYNNFVLSKNLVEIEQQNVGVAAESYSIANEQYKAGAITAVELRDAQQNLLNAELRLFSAQYEMKLNETELLRLSGELVKL